MALSLATSFPSRLFVSIKQTIFETVESAVAQRSVKYMYHVNMENEM